VEQFRDFGTNVVFHQVVTASTTSQEVYRRDCFLFEVVLSEDKPPYEITSIQEIKQSETHRCPCHGYKWKMLLLQEGGGKLKGGFRIHYFTADR
jgi:hypothetical protein